jgi:uncharacterized membrane protein
MSPELLHWIVVAHIFGFVLWIGNLFASMETLRIYKDAGSGAKDVIDGYLKKAGTLMDVGAALTIATGVTMLINLSPSPIKKPWMHIKLTLVAVFVLGVHGFLRAQIKRHRNGAGKTPPTFLAPLLTLAVVSIVVLVKVKYLAR